MKFLTDESLLEEIQGRTTEKQVNKKEKIRKSGKTTGDYW